MEEDYAAHGSNDGDGKYLYRNREIYDRLL
jgi:hypothetical protein